MRDWQKRLAFTERKYEGLVEILGGGTVWEIQVEKMEMTLHQGSKREEEMKVKS